MNASEAAMALGVAASFDRRTVGEADAHAWAAALHDVTFEEARDAIVGHYRDRREWVMPADIRTRARAARRDALAAIPPTTPPRALADDPQGEQAWQRRYRADVAAGMTPGDAYAAACTATGVPPDGPRGITAPGPLRAVLGQITDTMRGSDR